MSKLDWEKNKVNQRIKEQNHFEYLEGNERSRERKQIHDLVKQDEESNTQQRNIENEKLKIQPRTCKIVKKNGMNFPGESRTYIDQLCRVVLISKHNRVIVQKINESNPNKSCGFDRSVVEFTP